MHFSWSVAWGRNGRPETREFLKNRSSFLRVPGARRPTSRLRWMSRIFTPHSGLFCVFFFPFCPSSAPDGPTAQCTVKKPSVPVQKGRSPGTPAVTMSTLRCHVQTTCSERYPSPARAEQTTNPTNLTSCWARSTLVLSACAACRIGSF